uniref:Uncharacterized protein n=1 Tax=Parastrongyloides trichosuri TaxID=131310 RepID=A0A0N4ZK60_PARTI
MELWKSIITILLLITPILSLNLNIPGYKLREKLKSLRENSEEIFEKFVTKKPSNIRVISPIRIRKQSRNCFFTVIQCYLPKVDVYKSADNVVYGKLRNGRTYYRYL